MHPVWSNTISCDSPPRGRRVGFLSKLRPQTYKKRPALVVQSDRAATELPQVVLALITSNLNRRGATRVLIRRDSGAGLRMRLFVDSVIVCDVVQTMGTDAIVRIIGACPAMGEVGDALRFTFDL
jgi:mRNA interferase MazF